MTLGNRIKEMLLMTRRGLLFLLLSFSFIVYNIYKRLVKPSLPAKQTSEFVVPKENAFIFPGVTGPVDSSVIAPPHQRPSWRIYGNKNEAAIAVLLTDTTSCWLGLVQGLSNIGIPFTVTTSTDIALTHKVVLVYPVISGKVLQEKELKALNEFPAKGGVLIATNVYGGGMQDIFGYTDIVPSSERTVFRLKEGNPIPSTNGIFGDMTDKAIAIAGKGVESHLETVGYTGAQTPVISFEDSTACITYKDHGVGKAYAIGVDLGSFFERYMNGRGFDPDRAYVNVYDAGIDVFLRILKDIYVSNEPGAVTTSPVPFGKPFTMVITHDIDFTRSIINAATYADMEKAKGVKATYFIQTKYIRDWNDDIFFNTDNIKYLLQIQNDGMEIGSHSVAHSKVFSKFAVGTGKEQYPDYKPFVKDRDHTYNGTVLGELRVSKFMLEHFAPGVTVRSFRPGHLQYPFALPQALEATGFHNSTSITSGGAQTNFPYMLMYNREYNVLTDVVEIPVAIEDEAGLPMLQRFDSTVLMAGKLAKYGGVLNVLIHTDITGQKFEYEEKLIDRYKDTAWVATMNELCTWWRNRKKVHMSTTHTAKEGKVILSYESDGSINGLTLQVPAQWTLLPGKSGVRQDGHNVVIDELSTPMELNFKVGK